MKKIMFNDKYGLTKAVLDGRKTQTRRTCAFGSNTYEEAYRKFMTNFKDRYSFADELIKHSIYKIGEEVAVAQSYFDTMVLHNGSFSGMGQTSRLLAHPGAKNKMFVKAEDMPHRIKITNVRVEHLQDINEEDCLKEGFEEINVNNGVDNMLSHWEYRLTYEDKLDRSLLLGSRDYKEAFAALIDKVSGNGTWDSNPWVFVYDFKLIK